MPNAAPFPKSRLSQAEQQFFRMSIDMLCIANQDCYFVHLNPSWEKVLGWSLDELKSVPFFEFIHPDDLERTRIEANAIIGKNFETLTFSNRYRHKDGSYRWINWSARGDNGYIYAVAKDVTESKESEFLLHQIERTAKIGGWRLNPNTMQKQWTSEVYQIHDVEPGFHLTLDECCKFYPPEGQETIFRAFDQCMKNGTPFDVEVPFVTAKNNRRWVRLIGRAVRDGMGNVYELIGVLQDITEQYESNLAKAELIRRMDLTAKNSPGMIYQYRHGPEENVFSFTYWSPQFYSMFRIPKESITPEVLFDLVLPQFREGLWNSILDSVRTRKHFTWTGQAYTYDKSSILWLSCHSIPDLQPDGSVLFDGIITDITNQKRLEEQVERERIRALTVSKLASLGEMAGGIAHEINNPLAIILGRAYQLRGMIERGEPTSEKLDVLQSITETCERIVQIVQGMKSLLRNSNQDSFTRFNLSQAVKDTLSFSEERLRSLGIELIVNLDDGVAIFGNLSQVSQVLLNLLNNAADAVRKLPTPWIKIESWCSETEAFLAVANNGAQIPEQIKDRIMEPFFTTKPPGKGSGLGLSISANIMSQHNGKLILDPGVDFTRFVASFPLLQ